MAGLGRIYVADERDKNYPFTSYHQQLITGTSDPSVSKKFWWSGGWWGDQGYTPQCVAYAFNHWLADGPVSFSMENVAPIAPETLYCEAQKVDPWPGDCSTKLYDGTSVRAGATVLKNLGYIKEYRWITDIDTLVSTVLNIAPVVVGTLWLENMFNTVESNGYVLDVSGSSAGGHAYLVNGVDLNRGVFRIKNSWSQYWGKYGHAYIKIEDMDSLLRNFGEACVLLQKGLPEW